MKTLWKHGPKKNDENDMDPDDATSTKCGACKLPIFSTPIKSFPPNTTPLPFKLTSRFESPVILHDHCADLPGELHGHALHPHQPLILRNTCGDEYERFACGRCYCTIEEDIMYECPDSQCRFQLDLFCAGVIRILHRIHKHTLTPVRSEAGLRFAFCDACGIRHRYGYSDMYYLCTLCGFRLQPACASLPSAIVKNHRHALRLSFHVGSFNLLNYIGAFDLQNFYNCRICGSHVAGSGVYFCGKCRYYVHIKCVVSDPRSPGSIFGARPPSNCLVPFRDANFADVLHFPLEDEYTSVIRYILAGDDWHPHQIEGKFTPENTTSSSDESDNGDQIEGSEENTTSISDESDNGDQIEGSEENTTSISDESDNGDQIEGSEENTTSISDESDNGDQIEGKFTPEEIHEHTLIFHGQDDTDQLPSRVCRACVRLISPPFYSCSVCPNFFLHDCCARLPRELNHPLHPDHALHLFTPASKSYCLGCGHYFKGFIYSCKTCAFDMDVICTLMPPTITHDSHGKSNILYTNLNNIIDPMQGLNCCRKKMLNYYECSNIRIFYLHAKCAALPRTISHKHDQHPLKLTDTRTLLAATDDQERLFCETCERSITDAYWCYSCNECDQFFHSECIPSANPFVRDGATIHVSYHACPLALVRNYESVYKCGICSRDINFKDDEWVYECSDQCYFRIHEECAEKCLES